jgi:hypothetical protein
MAANSLRAGDCSAAIVLGETARQRPHGWGGGRSPLALS